MGYITGWIVVGIITLGIYKLFELFVGKKERLTMIEKLGDKLDPSMLGNRLSLPLPELLSCHLLRFLFRP